MLTHGRISVDTDLCIVRCDNKIISLLPQEYRLFLLFLKYPRHVLSYNLIIDYLWQDIERIPTQSTVRTHIKRLRKAFKKANITEDIIETVHGLGYRLKPLSNHYLQQKTMYTPSLAILQKFLKIKAIEYIVINTQMTIQFFTPEAKVYCDYPECLEVGCWVGEAFPELIGLEETIKRITAGEDRTFELSGVARNANYLRPEYINFYIFTEQENSIIPQDNTLLFVFLEDNSSNMIYQQKLVQNANESFLLLELDH